MPARIYTRTGDQGETGLFGGERVGKDDLRVEAYGTVDELNAVLGAARTQSADSEIDSILLSIQHDLFHLGSDLATPREEDTEKGRIVILRVKAERVDRLEAWIDRFEAELPALSRFILPGGAPLAASLHLGRVVCRRAERRCVTLARTEASAGRPPINSQALRYLNRLSDLLFVLARLANHRAGVSDVFWDAETM